VAALIASVWLPLLRGPGAAAIAVAIGLGLLQWLLDRLAGPIAITGLVVGALAGGYWLWGRWKLWQLSGRLAAQHPDAAVALRAAATGHTGRNGRHREWRKRLRESLGVATMSTGAAS
jgi:hypothetical protein